MIVWLIVYAVCTNGYCREYPANTGLFEDRWSCEYALVDYRRNFSSFARCKQEYREQG